MLYNCFDYLVRCYARALLFGVITLFIAGELGYKNYAHRAFLMWAGVNCALLIIAWLLQLRLNKFVHGNSDRLLRLVLLFKVRRVPFPHEMPVWWGGAIPLQIKTVVPEANQLLGALQRVPFLLDISTTQFDHDWRRLSWLRIRKDEPDAILEELKLGDMIYYHHKRSLVGKWIRLFTRSYWEHVATYIGEHEVLDVAPGGVRRQKLRPWIENPDVDLTVIRAGNVAEKLNREVLLRNEGAGYNYFGVLKLWWRIITGQTGLGGVGLFRVLFYCVVTCTVGVMLSAPPVHTRVETIWLLLLSIYVIETIYHPIAYKSDLDKAFTLNNETQKHEESRNKSDLSVS